MPFTIQGESRRLLLTRTIPKLEQEKGGKIATYQNPMSKRNHKSDIEINTIELERRKGRGE